MNALSGGSCHSSFKVDRGPDSIMISSDRALEIWRTADGFLLARTHLPYACIIAMIKMKVAAFVQDLELRHTGIPELKCLVHSCPAMLNNRHPSLQVDLSRTSRLGFGYFLTQMQN